MVKKLKLKLFCVGLSSHGAIIPPIYEDDKGNYWTRDVEEDSSFIPMNFEKDCTK